MALDKTKHPRLYALVQAGKIQVEGDEDSYEYTHTSFSREFFFGKKGDEDSIETYLKDHPHPKYWK